jgi:hypothetical protein
METIFLSYTYRSHPDHEDDLENLRRYVVRAIEAMGLRVVDGVDVGGRPLDEALKKRIDDADALIALMTPQADNANAIIEPAFVLSEFGYADARDKPTMRVQHDKLPVQPGLVAGHEYAPYTPGSELKVLLKLLNTIAVWKRENKQVARVRIEPHELAVRYDEERGDTCTFQAISKEGDYGVSEPAKVLQEPGAAYAKMKLFIGDKVRLRMHLQRDNRIWKSPIIDPFVGGARLEEQP